MARRFRRSKGPTPDACPACGRAKGARKVAKCNRCPGQSVAQSLELEPLRGARLIAVDPGKVSSVSITSPTTPNRLEVCRDLNPLSEALDDIVDAAVQRSEVDGAPLWMVIEEPGQGGDFATPSMLVGMGQPIGMWRRSFVVAGGADSRVILVRQVTWQAGALSGADAHAGHADRDARIDRSIEVARAVWGSETESGSPFEWTPDRAASALLAWFVLRWPAFVDQVGVRDRAAAQRVVDAGRETLTPVHIEPRGEQRSLFG